MIFLPAFRPTTPCILPQCTEYDVLNDCLPAHLIPSIWVAYPHGWVAITFWRLGINSPHSWICGESENRAAIGLFRQICTWHLRIVRILILKNHASRRSCFGLSLSHEGWYWVIVVIDSLHKNHVEVSITAKCGSQQLEVSVLRIHWGAANGYLMKCLIKVARLPKKPRPTVPHRLWEVRKCPEGFHKHGDSVWHDRSLHREMGVQSKARLLRWAGWHSWEQWEIKERLTWQSKIYDQFEHHADSHAAALKLAHMKYVLLGIIEHLPSLMPPTGNHWEKNTPAYIYEPNSNSSSTVQDSNLAKTWYSHTARLTFTASAPAAELPSGKLR